MIGRCLAIAALGGTFLLGGAMAASASPTTTAPTHARCSDAPKVLARISALEAKENALVAKATSRETSATKGGHTRLAKLIEEHITLLEKREARTATRLQRIEAACPGSATIPASSSTS